MMRRCWVEVDGLALKQNLKQLRSLIPESTRILVVLKANAYGHGLVPMAQECAANGVEWFGVANLAEGAALREAGISTPILLLSAALPEEMEEGIKYDLSFTISSFEEASVLSRKAIELGEQAAVHFKVDTGMGRLGCWYEDAEAKMRQIEALPGIQMNGLMTHFSAPDDNELLTREQWNRITPFFKRHPSLVRHAENSLTLVGDYGFHADLVRIGLALYGVVPGNVPGFVPTMTWKSRITLIREVGPNRGITYGATYVTKQTERHAVVAVGYGDGYFRAHSNGAGMLVHGKRCPIRGRVTMDQVVLDVTGVDCKVGDDVVLLGRQQGGEITAWELAREAGTIPWEVLTNVSSRVHRHYTHFQSQTA